jgi:hypothetical protein
MVVLVEPPRQFAISNEVSVPISNEKIWIPDYLAITVIDDSHSGLVNYWFVTTHGRLGDLRVAVCIDVSSKRGKMTRLVSLSKSFEKLVILIRLGRNLAVFTKVHAQRARF